MNWRASMVGVAVMSASCGGGSTTQGIDAGSRSADAGPSMSMSVEAESTAARDVGAVASAAAQDVLRAFASGDQKFLLDTLHPQTWTFWSHDECMRRLPTSKRSAAEVVGTTEPIEVEMRFGDGSVVQLFNAIKVAYRQDGLDKTMSLEVIDGRGYWFMNCDPEP